jgi:hypothetical protein
LIRFKTLRHAFGSSAQCNLTLRAFVVPPANGRGARETIGFAGMLASPWMGVSAKSLNVKLH